MQSFHIDKTTNNEIFAADCIFIIIDDNYDKISPRMTFHYNLIVKPVILSLSLYLFTSIHLPFTICMLTFLAR